MAKIKNVSGDSITIVTYDDRDNKLEIPFAPGEEKFIEDSFFYGSRDINRVLCNGTFLLTERPCGLDVGGAGTGDVVGPPLATDNALTRYDGPTGVLIQNSTVLLDDAGNITGTNTIDGRDISVDGAKLDGIQAGAEVNPQDVTQPEAEAGVVTGNRTWSPERVKDAILALAPGDVTGSTTSTLNSIPRYADGTGKVIKDSSVIIDNAGNITGVGTVDGRDIAVDGLKLDGIEAGAEVNPDVVSQAEAEAGIASTERIWTAERVKQAILALSPAGTGDVVGPGVATNNAISLYDGTSGKLIKNSTVTIDGSGNIVTSGTVDGRDVSVDGAKLDGIQAGAEVNPSVVPQLEAEAGLATTERIWTAERVKQAIDSLAPQGDVVGPLSAVDTGIAIFDGITGKLIKDSAITIDGSGNIAGLNNITLTGTVDGRDVSVDGTNQDTHIGDATIHFTQGAIDHTAISNIGVNSHATIDSHISDLTIHRSINDAGSTTTDLYSADKINSLISGVQAGAVAKESVLVATETDGDITLSGIQTIDGVLLVAGDRVGVTNQTDPIENGIYLASAGAWTRALDFDGTPSGEVRDGVYFRVRQGTNHAQHSFMVVSSGATVNVGVDAVNFDETAAIEFGTTAGTATEGNDSRVPTQDENDALVGTDGTPSALNKYVTNSDPRMTDSRTPTAHATTHEDGGGDELTVQNLGSGAAVGSRILETDGAGGWQLIPTPVGGGGDVVGPASATDTAVALYDGASGNLIKNSSVTIDGSGNISTSGTVDGRNLSVDGAKLDGIQSGAQVNAAAASLAEAQAGTEVALRSWSPVRIKDAIDALGNNGDVVGPASSTDNAIARYDLASGKLIQNSVVIIDDLGNVTGVNLVDGRDISVDGTKLDTIQSGAEVNPTVVSQPEAEAGIATTERTWTSERVAQAIAAQTTNGDVVGPAGSTDTAITIYDGTSGKLIKNTGILISPANGITGIATLNTSGNVTVGGNINMSALNTVDGRDVSVDGTKLDTIQSGAEVNPTVVPQAEAEAGIATTERIWTAERVKQAIDALAPGGGETNTASNVGVAGIGVFKQKTGVDLEFKNVNAGSNKISVTDDIANNEIDIDINEGNLTHNNFGGIGTDDHHARDHASSHSDGGADEITAQDLGSGASAVGLIMETDGAGGWNLISTPSGGSGEANTSSNVNVGGVGVFKQKTGVDLEFKGINAGSNKISVTDDAPNNEIDIDVNEGNITHNNLGGIGVDDHHSENHATRHEDGGLDELTVQNLGSAAAVSGKVLETDGAGGWTLINTPSGGSGEVNTASNVGVGGISVFKQKTGVDLEFNSVNAGSNKISVSIDAPNNEIEIDVIEGNLTHNNIGSIGVDDHHARDHASSHSNGGADEVTVENLGTGSVNVNHVLKADGAGGLVMGTIPASAIPSHASTHENGGADEINVGGLSGLLADPQTPTTHATSHEDGGADELTVQNLGSGAALINKMLESDGAGGWNLIDTPTGTVSPLTTKGDLYTYDTVDQRLAVGSDGQVLTADSAEPTGIKWVTPVDNGENNTASNVGTAGVGVFKQKTGVDLEFKKINAGSNKVSVVDDVANNEVDVDVNEGNLTHNNMGGIGTDDHHTENHASRHSDGGADELTVQNLGSGAATAGKILESDGVGGWTLVNTPSGGVGDVVGPAGATDSAVALYDTVTGKLLKNSVVTIDGSGNITTAGTVDGRDLSTDGSKLDGIAAGAEVNVQSDWNAVSGDAFIQNKPAISGSNTGDEVQATETVSGIAEVATQVETDAGTDDTRMVTPLKLANYSGLGAGGLDTKSGVVLAAAFSGNPKKATVNLTTSFADANYSPVVSSVANNNKSYKIIIESITASSFVINMDTNNINDLVDVRWIAVKHGES